MNPTLRHLMICVTIGLAILSLDQSSVRADDWNDHDRFLGQISMSYIRDAFHDRVDGFSGNLHINMVDVKLPGHGGLDLIVQRYYSSNIWNRVEGGVYTKHAASSDPMDHLGGCGWQLHMGKVIQPLLSTDPWMAVMPDGSTHLLYNSTTGQGRISRDRWTFNWNSSTGKYDLTLTDGTVYSFDPSYSYADYHNQTVYQCTRISKPGVTSSSIQIQYDSSHLLSTITDTYGRTVTFSYVGSPSRIQTMTVSTGQTWQFTYSANPQDTFGQQNGQSRSVYTLNSVTPPAGNAWAFTYNPSSTSYGNGKYCLQKVTFPTNGSNSYTYTPVSFNTGTQSCNVQFCVVASRVVKDRNASVIGTWSYIYTSPGSDGATTSLTVKDAQNNTLLTDVSVFNGWGSYTGFDPNMWKVGLLEQRTVTTSYGLSTPQTEVETYTWSQGDTLSSSDWDQTTNWVGCGSYRQWHGIYFAKPSDVTRSVTRESGVTYTTDSSSFDSYGNPLSVAERVNSTQKRTTQLTYWYNTTLNILVDKVATKSPSPGAPECFAYDTYGRQTKKILNPSSLTPCTGGSSSLETDIGYDASSGDVITETKVNYGGQNSETDYLSYSYGQPQQIKVYGTNIWFDRTINPSGTVATSTDGRGNASQYRTSYQYDNLSRLTAIQPPASGSLATTFTYAADWSTVTVTRGGHSIVYSFDGLGRLTQRQDQETTHTVQVAYNALGVKTQQKFLYDTILVDTSAYDALGRLLSLTHAGDGSEATCSYAGTPGTGPTVTVQDEDAKQTTLAYEAFGDPGDTRLLRVTDAASSQTSYQYNSYNLVSGITAPLSQGNRSFTYYPQLFLHTEIHPESGTTTYVYDGLGNVSQKTQQGGAAEYFSYDQANRLIQRSFSDSTPTVTFTWDGASQRTQMSSSDGTFAYVYDGNKNLTSKQSTRSGVGSVTETFSYDTVDRLDTATYPSGRAVKHTYDNQDWVTAVKSTSGGSDYASSITRWVTGAIDQISLGNGATTTYGLDNRYRVDSISTSASVSVLSLTFNYDSVSNLTQWYDYLNVSNDRSFSYDALHRLTDASAPSLWGDLTLGYDALGNRTTRGQTKNSQTLSTTYTYDSNNRLTRATTGSLYESYAYDARGNLGQAIIPQPTITSLSPDHAKVQPSGGSTTLLITINGTGFVPSSSASFNGSARSTTFMTASMLQMTITYDDLKTANIYQVKVINPAAPEKAGPQALSASAPFVVYFIDVPPTHPQYSSVNLIAYNGITAGCGSGNYCPDNNLKRSEMAVFLLTAEHGPSYVPPACTGVFSDVACPSGFAVTWIEQFYHEGITAGCGTNPLRYCPDANTTKAEMAVFLLATKQGPSYVPPACTGIFADVPCPSGFAVNWIEEIDRRGIDTGCGGGNYCPTSPVSRALMAQMVARTWNYQMPWTAPNTASDTYTYTFNAANQLTAVQAPSGTVSFSYDGDGQRFSKATTSGTVFYVRDGQGQVIAEYSGTAALLAEYVYADDQRLCKITKDANNVEHRVYYHADVLGTPVAETNESGQLITKAEYYPFGDEVTPGAAADPHKFTGKELDSEFGLYYFGARYYDAHLGRFVSVDPAPLVETRARQQGVAADIAGLTQVDPARNRLSSPQSLNRYTYSLNNPLRYLDPTGRWPTEVHNQIITEAFSTGSYALPEGVRAILMRASAAVDSETQDVFFSYLHAMRAPYETPEHAQAEMETFIAQKVGEFHALMSQGEKEKAYFALGEAMHPLMDSTSPAHEGFQKWTGLDVHHPFRETSKVFYSKPEYMRRSVELLRELYDKATNQ